LVLEHCAVAFGGRRDPPLRILEVGCGSGAVSVALLRSLPRSTTATCLDVDPAAVALTTDNARRFRVHPRLTVLLCAAAEFVGGPFDIVVSNPPCTWVCVQKRCECVSVSV
jgi:release factor glutamine methyltransferase